MKFLNRIKDYYMERFDPTSLAKLQDNIITIFKTSNNSINIDQIGQIIKSLERYSILFKIGFPHNNLYIRNKFILSALYKILNDEKNVRLLNQGRKALLKYINE